jgi:hypothetical protein
MHERRLPIGCGEEDAMEYMGLSDRPNIWEELKARKVVKALRRNWYCYEDLDEAIAQLRSERDKVITLPAKRGAAARKFKTPESFTRA